MNVGVCLMAMQERSAYVDDIVSRLDVPPMIVWDEKRDRYDTGRRALIAHRSRPDVTHWLVLQDDALPCRDLVAGVTRGVERVPNNPLSLYYGHGTNGAHQRTNSMARSAPVPGLLVFEGPWWGVAVCFPVGLIDTILRHSDRPQSTPAYDKRLSRALGRMNVDTYYLLPSLVDHRLEGESMIPGRSQDDRHAHHFIGENASALDIDWDALPVVDGHRRRNTRTRMNEVPPPPMMLRPRTHAVADPSVSIAVMAHPRRRGMAEALAEQVGAEVVYDRHDDRWETGKRAWLAHDPDATHHLVLQDDAIAAPGMADALRDALRVVGDNPVGLYLGGVRPATQLMGAMVSHARSTGASWVSGEGPLWGVGVCLPTHMIEPMVAWCDQRNIPAYDRRMAAYFRQKGIACWYTMPSLVDHRGDEPSLVGNRPVRRARWFAADGADGVDWTRLPHTTGKAYVTFTGPAARRFHRCLHCGFYTPMRHSIDRHVRECVGSENRMSHAEL